MLTGTAALLCVLTALSGNARAENLNEAFGRAYVANPTLQADRARQLATDEKLPQARSNWLPSVSASAQYGYSNNVDKSVPNQLVRRPGFDSYNVNPYSYGVSLQQPIFRGFRTVNETRSAKANIAAGHAQLVDTEQNVMLNVAGAYLGVLRDQRIVAHRRRSLQIVSKILRTSRAQFKSGVNTRTDVSQAEARYNAARADLDKALADFEVSKASYAQLVGQAPGKLSDPTPVAHLLPLSLTDTVALAREANPRLAAALHLENAAHFDRKAAVGEFMPTLDLHVDYLHEHDVSYSTSEQETTNVMLKLNVPIFTKGIEHSRVRAAKAVEMQRRYEARDAQYGVTAAAQTAWEQHESAKRRVALIERQVAAARAAAKGVRKEREIGDRSVLDELNAEQEIVSARVSLENARYERRITEYTLIASVGRLRAETLGLGTAVYDATKNSKRVAAKFLGTSMPDLERVADAGTTGEVTGSIATHDSQIGGVPVPSVRPGSDLTPGSAAVPPAKGGGVPGVKGDGSLITGLIGARPAKPLSKQEAAAVFSRMVKERPGDHFFKFAN